MDKLVAQLEREVAEMAEDLLRVQSDSSFHLIQRSIISRKHRIQELRSTK